MKPKIKFSDIALYVVTELVLGATLLFALAAIFVF